MFAYSTFQSSHSILGGEQRSTSTFMKMMTDDKKRLLMVDKHSDKIIVFLKRFADKATENTLNKTVNSLIELNPS